ncbi:hypothetical protein HYD56_01405 [Mycoplasmopsis bovis]|nr:hypothetical protein [Mycoplasmopsis bovis]QQH66558.1 hypothetical protein HYD56_01405 [Mycoplasmopsis bovis]
MTKRKWRNFNLQKYFGTIKNKSSFKMKVYTTEFKTTSLIIRQKLKTI